MVEPPFPLEETQRQLSLLSLRILDSKPEQRFDRITRMAARLFDVERCLIGFVDANRLWFKSQQGIGADEIPRKASFCAHTILNDRVFIVCDASKDPRFLDNPYVNGEPGIRFYAGCPVRCPQGFRVGTLCLIDSAPRRISEDEQDILRDLAAMVEDELRAVAHSSIDELTQIANRRGFHETSRHMLSLCRRVNSCAELAFFDLDGFKHINEQHGYAAGDEVLKHFAHLLSKCFRSADVVARLGGDEFGVFMAGANGKSGSALQRLNKLCEETRDRIDGKLAWSVGRIAFDPDRHTTIESMLADADSRMYADKVRKRQNSG